MMWKMRIERLFEGGVGAGYIQNMDPPPLLTPWLLVVWSLDWTVGEVDEPWFRKGKVDHLTMLTTTLLWCGD
jgi:hypothetical protein